MTISAQDVRRLLDAEHGSTLVLIEGRTEVISGQQKSSDQYRGAFEVISRDELLSRTGGAAHLTDDQISTQAAALDTAVNELGG